MSHTYHCLAYHAVFSTKGRKLLIHEPFENDVWRYIGGIARGKGFDVLLAGGMPDHVHVLFMAPTNLDVAKAIQYLKGASSKWFREKHDPDFQWQQGYGIFSVSHSLIPKTEEYIRNQKSHHKKMDFAAEYRLLLEKHGVKYDEQYLLG